LIKRGVAPDQPFETIETTALNGFRAEAESFARLVRGTDAQWQGATPEESIDIARTLEAILQSARAGRPVDI
jgi:predicted dehydrogenase